jgi:hypothetical protein
VATALPGPVRQYVERVLPSGPPSGRTVRIGQVGEMVLKPGARPRRFTAIEDISTERVAFWWRARFPMLGPVALRVTDSVADGSGRLAARLLGLPLQREHGAELAQGEGLRYLAEIPWAPQAILANHELRWREFDERTVEVGARVAGTWLAVRLAFDEAGEIVKTLADRPRAEAGNVVTPWIGQFTDYRTFDGVRVPSHGEVRWELPDGPFTYWRGTITSWELHT